MPCTPTSSSRVYGWCYFSRSPSYLCSRCAFHSTEFGQGGRPDTLVLLCLRVWYQTLNFLIIKEYFLTKIRIKTPTATRIGRYVHSPPPVSTAQQSQGGTTICTIRFCFGIARVLYHSLWYADKLAAQLNGCASSTSQSYALDLCYAPMRWRRTNICRLPCRQKVRTLLGGPFHSEAPRLCLPCLPCRDATVYNHKSLGRSRVAATAGQLLYVRVLDQSCFYPYK